MVVVPLSCCGQHITDITQALGVIYNFRLKDLWVVTYTNAMQPYHFPLRSGLKIPELGHNSGIFAVLQCILYTNTAVYGIV